MTKERRKKLPTKANRKVKRKYDPKRTPKDVDLIFKEVQELRRKAYEGHDDEVIKKSIFENDISVIRISNEAVDPELPGEGRFRCICCDRYFIDRLTLEKHSKTKHHKRRRKAMNETPYSQREADSAAGLGEDNGNIMDGLLL